MVFASVNAEEVLCNNTVLCCSGVEDLGDLGGLGDLAAGSSHLRPRCGVTTLASTLGSSLASGVMARSSEL